MNVNKSLKPERVHRILIMCFMITVDHALERTYWCTAYCTKIDMYKHKNGCQKACNNMEEIIDS